MRKTARCIVRVKRTQETSKIGFDFHAKKYEYIEREWVDYVKKA